MSTESAQAQAERRSQVYWFLSRFYLNPPKPAFLEEIGGAPATGNDGLPGAGDGLRLPRYADDPGLEQAMEALSRALEGGKGGDRQADLEREYTRLFRGIKEGYGPPPPYESVYRQSRLMGEVTLAVLDQYRQAGFPNLETGAGPRDHIGAEFKFMALLCFAEAEAEADAAGIEQWRKRQTAFLDRHLLCWIPGYCERIAEHSREPLYTALAALTGRVVSADRAFLQRPATFIPGVRPIPRPTARDAPSP